jgi:hypothetical protein
MPDGCDRGSLGHAQVWTVIRTAVRLEGFNPASFTGDVPAEAPATATATAPAATPAAPKSRPAAVAVAANRTARLRALLHQPPAPSA